MRGCGEVGWKCCTCIGVDLCTICGCDSVHQVHNSYSVGGSSINDSLTCIAFNVRVLIYE